VSHLKGITQVGTKEIAVTFTAADFELVAAGANGSESGGALDAIRFRKKGRKPVSGSSLVVNYYPLETDPTPLTDLNVGSVVRTLMETISRELATTELQVEQVYRSAFLETAEGSSLDKLVALVGLTRLPAGFPVVKVRLTRQAGSSGRITVPANTPLTGPKGIRYLTLSEVTFEAGESTREVMARGEETTTTLVEVGELDRLEVLVAGVSQVHNEQGARRLAAPENDDELRRRTRGALQGVVRGTLDAITFGLLSLPEVKDVSIIEEPNGVPGEIRIDIVYAEATPEAKLKAAEVVEEFRPAGIRVVIGEPAKVVLSVRVELTLTGDRIEAAELKQVTDGVKARLTRYLTQTPPGGTVRRAKLVAAVMDDARIADAQVVLGPLGRPETDELALGTSEALELAKPETFTFAPAKFERQRGGADAVNVSVEATIPVFLVGTTTSAEASEAITMAIDAHLKTRSGSSALSVDSIAAGARDETRYVIVRGEVVVTVINAGRFIQLSDGAGDYRPAPNETLVMGTISVPTLEGGV